MKFALVALILLASGNVFAGDGVCKANAYNPNFDGLCRQFNGEKSLCAMNARTCDWISLSSNGVCRANSYNPSFAALCSQFDQGACAMNARTCDWIETD